MNLVNVWVYYKSLQECRSKFHRSILWCCVCGVPTVSVGISRQVGGSDNFQTSRQLIWLQGCVLWGPAESISCIFCSGASGVPTVSIIGV